MPLGAMIARADLMTWSKGHHGSTFGGNAVSCAAALETIALLKEGLMDNAEERGRQAQDGLRPMIDQHRDVVRDVRGKGLMLGVQFDSGDTAEAVQWACFERGLLVLEAGDDVVRMSPPLIVDEAEVATAVRIFREAVDAVAADPEGSLDRAHKWGAMDGVHVGG
jgi:4-aminobutyrate aminotransferase